MWESSACIHGKKRTDIELTLPSHVSLHIARECGLIDPHRRYGQSTDGISGRPLSLQHTVKLRAGGLEKVLACACGYTSMGHRFESELVNTPHAVDRLTGHRDGSACVCPHLGHYIRQCHVDTVGRSNRIKRRQRTPGCHNGNSPSVDQHFKRVSMSAIGCFSFIHRASTRTDCRSTPLLVAAEIEVCLG